MAVSRRNVVVALAGLATGATSILSFAETPPKPFVVYDNELKNGWQNWSWAKVELSSPIGEIKPIKVQGDPWTALSLHHDAFSTSPFSKLTFYINGGVDGQQSLMVKVLSEGKTIDSNFIIQPKSKTWAIVEVTLKEIGAENKNVDGLVLQGMAAAYKPYYVTRIQFE